METKINIAEILKNKPKGTKLYTDAFGELSIEDIFTEDEIGINLSTKDGDDLYFYNDGKYNVHGEPILFPSKEMRDWSKFSWKKGDVLRHAEYPLTVIFESFEDDIYTSFKCKYCFNFESASKWLVSNSQCSTKHFYKVSDEEAKEFIKKVELNYNGKLKMETLEIEPAQPEFKDGDILSIQEDKEHYHTIFILKGGTDVYVFFDYFHRFLTYGTKIDKNEKSICRLATEDEKKVLFDALAKEGKRWDAEKKQIVDIKKAPKFKPFEKVLVRDSYGDMWRACLFSHIIEDDGRYATTGLTWKFCIPYIGNEHLLGTTTDVEG